VTKATNALRTNALVHTSRLTQRIRHAEQNVVHPSSTANTLIV
jgi:hypothetical protein